MVFRSVRDSRRSIEAAIFSDDHDNHSWAHYDTTSTTLLYLLRRTVVVVVGCFVSAAVIYKSHSYDTIIGLSY